jgi:hypothetical protein
MKDEPEERKGIALWDYIEIKAREEFGKDKTWDLVAADLKDDEIASATLRCGKETVKGLVVYREVQS